MGGKPSRLRSALEALLGRGNPWEERDADDLIYGICLASGIGEERCEEVYATVHDAMLEYALGGEPESRDKALRGIREVMERFELRGSCLVERGVEVGDPSLCEGSVDGGLVVMGSRMQLSVDGSLRSAAVRVNGVCAVGVGGGFPWMPWVLKRLRSGARGLIGYDEAGAVFAVGQCGIGDLPRLVGEASGLKYEDVYYDCRVATGEEEDAEFEAMDEEYEDALRVLRGERTNG
jgi:hypothetical protein